MRSHFANLSDARLHRLYYKNQPKKRRLPLQTFSLIKQRLLEQNRPYSQVARLPEINVNQLRVTKLARFLGIDSGDARARKIANANRIETNVCKFLGFRDTSPEANQTFIRQYQEMRNSGMSVLDCGKKLGITREACRRIDDAVFVRRERRALHSKSVTIKNSHKLSWLIRKLISLKLPNGKFKYSYSAIARALANKGVSTDIVIKANVFPKRIRSRRNTIDAYERFSSMPRIQREAIERELALDLIRIESETPLTSLSQPQLNRLKEIALREYTINPEAEEVNANHSKSNGPNSPSAIKAREEVIKALFGQNGFSIKKRNLFALMASIGLDKRLFVRLKELEDFGVIRIKAQNISLNNQLSLLLNK